MILKVCGMRESENVRNLASVRPDWMGLIFYAKSPRCVSEKVPILNDVKRIGVFVNEKRTNVSKAIIEHDLDGIQFHGKERSDDCRFFRDQEVLVIKAFSVDAAFDFASMIPYEGQCDYYLFDTKGALPGGTGRTFDWSILNGYNLKTPFILSGGVGLDSIPQLQNFSHPLWFGVDVNSAFEDAPGLKNIDKLKTFSDALRR
ncbi:MAG: phosphoribosylanthranilate isomerase [Saprospiraceae bacterium]|nr:phosphoribosylanthranilate isomerase [Saprospiraceae bacterium]